MLALVLAFGSGMGWGAADFLGGVSARRLPLVTVALLIGLAGGLVGAGGLSALYRALAIGRMSVVAPTAALSGTVPVVWGLLRGERPSAVQLVGVGVAIAE